MSFNPVETAPVPVKPNRIQLTLTCTEAADLTRKYEGHYHFRVTSANTDPEGDNSREIAVRSGDPEPYMPAAIKAAVKQVLDWALDKAKETVA